MSRYEKKLNNKMDDEIKACLEALVPEELEKHLILNSNRLRTFEDARLEIVTYVEAKFGVRIRDSKPSDTGLREHSDPHGCWCGQLSLVSQRKRVIKSARWEFLGAVEHIINGTAMQARTPASNRLAKAIRGSHGPRASPQSQGKGTSKEHNGKFKRQSKGSKGAEGSGKGKTSKTGISSLEHLKSETSSETQESVHMGHVYTTDTSWIHDEWSPDEWNDGWSLDEWNDDWSCVGWHED